MAKTFGDILKGKTAETFDDILKFNPYHDRLGRFSSAGGAASFTYAPGKSKAHDLAIAREKQRTAAMDVSPEEKRKNAIKTIEDKIRKQDYESAACIDSDGKTIFFKDGEKSRVEFNAEETAQMKGNILTHNHPSSSIFSSDDIRSFVANEMQEMRVVCKNGNNYSIKRINPVVETTDYGTLLQENKFIDSYAKQRIKAQKDITKKFNDSGVPEKLKSGELSNDEVQIEYIKQVETKIINYLNKYSKTYGFEFSMEVGNNE